jgi:hypothetical protein
MALQDEGFVRKDKANHTSVSAWNLWTESMDNPCAFSAVFKSGPNLMFGQRKLADCFHMPVMSSRR